MDIYNISSNHKWWEIIVEYSNHCQMRWMDRKVSAKVIRAMVKRAINYCFSNKRSLKRRIVVRHFKKRCSIVVAMTFYDPIKYNMKLLVVTVVNTIMRVANGETIIDLLPDGGEKIYVNKIENDKKLAEV